MRIIKTRKIETDRKTVQKRSEVFMATVYTVEAEGKLYDSLVLDTGAVFTESHSRVRTPKELKEKIKLFVKNMSQK